MLTAAIAVLGTTLVGAIGYVFQLGNRVTRVETQQTDLPRLIEVQFNIVNQRLSRIEEALKK